MKIKSCFGSFLSSSSGKSNSITSWPFCSITLISFVLSSFNNFKLGIADSIIAGLSLYLGIPFDHQPESGNFENLDKLFIGPTSVAYSNDPVSTSKAIVDFAKENENLKILGASMSGKELSLNEIKHLASLPSMETLRAKIVGLLSVTQRGIVTTLQANQSNLIRVVNNKFKS